MQSKSSLVKYSREKVHNIAHVLFGANILTLSKAIEYFSPNKNG